LIAIELSKSSSVGLQIEYVDISALPFLNTDLEINGTYPSAVEAFRQKILAADSILFASPEYNYSVTGTSAPPQNTAKTFSVILIPCSLGIVKRFLENRKM